jgi:3D (Asp-Asp-Asp) domain-containing protein
MKNNYIFDKCILLIALSLMFLLFGVILYGSKPIIYDGFRAKDMYVELPDLVSTYEPVDRLESVRELNRTIASVPITVTFEELVLGDGHRVFLTAYCAEECGWNYSTSSGEICHREDDNYVPSTCAIDLNYFKYGTMFYVPSEDRVYIAEDTGAFRGMWIDTYQHSMSDVYSYNTRYETVYICWFEEVESSTYYIGGKCNPFNLVYNYNAFVN